MANDFHVRVSKEKELEMSDPEYAKLKMALKRAEDQINEIRIMIRKRRYDLLPESRKRIYDIIGWNPYKSEAVRRITGSFTIKEDK